MSDEVVILKRLYERFNARDMESVLKAMHEDDRPDSDLFVRGRDAHEQTIWI